MISLTPKAVLLDIIVLLGLGWAGGELRCMLSHKAMNDHIADQIQGKLTAKEKELQSANTQLGTVKATLKSTEKDLTDMLQHVSPKVYANVAELRKKYGVTVTDVTVLGGVLVHNSSTGYKIKDAAAAAAACTGNNGKLAWAVTKDHPYATADWQNYCSGTLKANLKLNTRVKVTIAHLQQDPNSKNGGILRAASSEVVLQDETGADIQGAELDPSSTFEYTPPKLLNDGINRRQFTAMLLAGKNIYQIQGIYKFKNLPVVAGVGYQVSNGPLGKNSTVLAGVGLTF